MTLPCPRLIEVALPIREISAESTRDKNIHHAHISHFHIWWARRPLAACRAIVFASLVPDPDHPDCPSEFRDAVVRLLKDEVPSSLQGYGRGKNWHRNPDPYQPYDGLQDTPRNRLLTFIAKWSPEWIAFEREGGERAPKVSQKLDDRCLVKWETSDPENKQGQEVLRIARGLVRIANNGRAPVLLDPFAGGGAIPLEALRLGCHAIANDYNPVAYLILRATCEFPQKYGKPGIRVDENGYERKVKNVLAHDVETWAKRILERARERIGHLYPPGEDDNPVVGYLWARTAPCSNPSCRATIPLLRSLLICNKARKKVAVTMRVEEKQVTFDVAEGQDITQTDGTMLNRGDCRCPICGQVTPVQDLRRAGLEGQMGERMVAVIVDTPHGKGYRPVEPEDLIAFEKAVKLAQEVERPSELILPEITGSDKPVSNRGQFTTYLYGMKTWGSLFNPRQRLAMQTFVACMHEALAEMERAIEDGEYRKAVAVYLGLWISRTASFSASVCRWASGSEIIKTPFGGQAIPMIWDYPEANPFADSSGTASTQLRYMLDVVRHESPGAIGVGGSFKALCADAAHLSVGDDSSDAVVTDPPYFNQISYGDLSDFFYVWLKRALSDVFPEVFSTPLTPKTDEATALRHRHGGDRQKADHHFVSKLTAGLTEAKRTCRTEGIASVMFAHQSTEAWTALINALLNAGLSVTATYPIETEMKSTALAQGTASLESSITVSCRPRKIGSVGAFRAVRQEIETAVAEAVRRYFRYGFRGADLIVAGYGPAVGVFGKYERVERADGTPIDVPELLRLAREAALKAIAGEFRGDHLSRLYFVWANLYGTGEAEWDDARLVVQMSSESDDAMDIARNKHLFVVEGSKCRLALLKDRMEQSHLGEGEDSPLIDRLHRAMQLWRDERRPELVAFLRDAGLMDHTPFWQLAQALFEVLPRGEEDWKLVSALLGERDTLRLEALRTVQRQGKLF